MVVTCARWWIFAALLGSREGWVAQEWVYGELCGAMQPVWAPGRGATRCCGWLASIDAVGSVGLVGKWRLASHRPVSGSCR